MKKKLIKIDEEYSREVSSMAVVSTNQQALLNAKLSKSVRLKDKERINKLEKEIEELKSTIKTIIKEKSK